MEMQEITYSLFFYIIAFVLVIAALGIVFLPRIIYSAVSMIITFFSVAGIFVLLNADFVAVSQIIIYAVGITIVMVFAIMLTGTRTDKKLWVALKFRTLIAFAAAGLLFLAVIIAVTNGFTQITPDTGIFAIKQPSMEVIQRLESEGTTSAIGESLLTKYVLPFEVLSLLLLAAIAGAVVIAGKGQDNLINPLTTPSEED